MHCKVQTHPLVRGGAPHEEVCICETSKNLKSGHGPQMVAGHQNKLADWLLIANSTPTYNFRIFVIIIILVVVVIIIIIIIIAALSGRMIDELKRILEGNSHDLIQLVPLFA
jgi:hypothetical protein